MNSLGFVERKGIPKIPTTSDGMSLIKVSNSIVLLAIEIDTDPEVIIDPEDEFSKFVLLIVTVLDSELSSIKFLLENGFIKNKPLQFFRWTEDM